MASNPTKREVYNYLRDKGLDDIQAMGILANISGESKLDVDAEGDRDSGGSIGLFQYNYNAGRAQPFVAAVPDWRTNWRGQIDYVIDRDPLTKPYLRQTFRSKEAAASYFMRKWEIPAQRVRAARDIEHNEFIRNNNFASNYQPGSSTSDSSTSDSSEETAKINYGPITKKITVPKEVSPEALSAINAVNSKKDEIAELIAEQGGDEKAFENWPAEAKEEYNKKLTELTQLELDFRKLTKTDASANCIARDTIGKTWTFIDSPDCVTLQKTTAYKNIRDKLLQPVDLPDPCGQGDLAKINTSLLKFFNDLKAIRQFGDTYINSTFNEIYRVTNLVRNTASAIGAVLKGIMQNLRNWLLDKIRRGIQDLIDKIFPTLAKQLKNTIIGQIIDNILCKFKDIIKNLGSLVGDFLFELIGNVVNLPLCGVQQFTNGLINNVVAKVDEALGPILDGINDLLGGAGKIVGSVFEALDFILGFEAYLCQKPNCPEIKSTILGPWSNSPDKPFGNGFDNFVGNAENYILGGGLEESVNGLSIFGGTLGDLANAPDASFPCDTDPFKCGPPSIEIFGGGGIGAVGKAVIDRFGRIYGIDVENGGSGYKKPPFVSIIDPCDNGRGASGYAVIDYETGQVIDIPVINPGYGYPNAPTGFDEFGDPVDPTLPGGGGTTPGGGDGAGGGEGDTIIDPDIVVNDYVVCLKGFDIISTGLGYTPTDEIIITPDVPNLRASVRITEEGQIVSITLTDEVCGLTDIPTVTIKSPTGEGVKIRPRFSFKRLTDDIEEETPSELIVPVDKATTSDGIINALAQRSVVRVIDCVGNTAPVIGYVNGQPYSGPFHVHPSKGVKMVGAFHIRGYHDTIYDTAEESLNRRRRSTQLSTPAPATPQTPASTSRPTPTPRPTPAPRSAPTPTPRPSPSPPSSSPGGGGGYGGY